MSYKSTFIAILTSFALSSCIIVTKDWHKSAKEIGQDWSQPDRKPDFVKRTYSNGPRFPLSVEAKKDFTTAEEICKQNNKSLEFAETVWTSNDTLISSFTLTIYRPREIRIYCK